MATEKTEYGFPVERAHPRWPSDVEVRYGSQELVSGRVVNLSEGGIGFTGEVSYPVGSDIEICLRQGARAGWFKARGVVRHCADERMGAQFVDLGILDRTRLLELIQQDPKPGHS